MAVASSSFLEAWRSFERRRRRLCVVVVVILFDFAVKDAFWSLPEHLWWWCDDDGNRKSDLIETTADLPPRVFDRATIDDEEDDLTVLVGGREALVGVAATALRMIRLTSVILLICRPILKKSYFFEALFFPFFFDFLFRFFSKYFLFFVVVRFCRNASFFFSLLLLLQFFLVVVVVVVVIVVVVVVVVSAR